MPQAPTLLFYDLETFGIDPQVDRIAQFAAVRTDLALNPIAEPLVLYCKISGDYLPDIEACLINGITPQETIEKGICEFEFIKKINKAFSVPNTCVLGYNNLRFDDEFIRNALYRNFFDPYKREWADGNTRWDIIDMVRMTHDLRPQGINWPKNEEGRTSFKLEDLSKANDIAHSGSHDALADVLATIALAKLIREKNVKVFDYFYENRDKNAVAKMISFKSKEMLVHTSRMFTSEQGCTTLIYPLITHPLRKNYILSYDLRYDPQPLIDLPLNELKELIFVSKDSEHYDSRIHIKGIQLNKCPIIAPLSVMDKEAYARLNIDHTLCKTNFYKLVAADKEVSKKLTEIYGAEPERSPQADDPDLQIYSGGFFDDADRMRFEIIRATAPQKLLALDLDPNDKRIGEMLKRLIGRNYPELLEGKAKEVWTEYCRQSLKTPLSNNKMGVTAYKQKLETMIVESGDKKDLLKSLLDWVIALEKTVS